MMKMRLNLFTVCVIIFFFVALTSCRNDRDRIDDYPNSTDYMDDRVGDSIDSRNYHHEKVNGVTDTLSENTSHRRDNIHDIKE